MKRFFVTHSYDMVKMFLNQFAIAIFGFSLVLAVGKAENDTLRNIISVFAIVFYLFLLYTMTWDIGFKDRIAVTNGRQKRNPYKGALIALCANIPNFIFAIFIALAHIPSAPDFIHSIGAVCSFLALALEGMYTGLLAISVGGTPLNAMWFMYFLLPLPAILTCGISYGMGLNDIKLIAGFNAPKPTTRTPEKKDDHHDETSDL